MDRGRDRWLLWMLLAHLPLGGLVALLHGTDSPVHSFIEILLIPAVAAVAYWQLAGTRAFRCVGAALLMGCSALLIHLAGGMIELHFHVFVVLALLIAYVDWLPISIAAATIAAHYVITWVFMPTVTYAGGASLSVVAIHVVFVVVEAAGLAYVAERLRRSLVAATTAAEALADVHLPALMAAIAAGNLTDAIDLIAAEALGVQATSVEMTGSAEGVGKAIEDIALVDGDTTAATDEVSTATQDTSSRIVDMRQRAASLSTTAAQLRAMVEQFRLGDEIPAQSVDRRRPRNLPVTSLPARPTIAAAEPEEGSGQVYGEAPLRDRRIAGPRSAGAPTSGVTPRRRASDWQRQSS